MMCQLHLTDLINLSPAPPTDMFDTSILYNSILIASSNMVDHFALLSHSTMSIQYMSTQYMSTVLPVTGYTIRYIIYSYHHYRNKAKNFNHFHNILRMIITVFAIQCISFQRLVWSVGDRA